MKKIQIDKILDVTYETAKVVKKIYEVLQENKKEENK